MCWEIRDLGGGPKVLRNFAAPIAGVLENHINA